MPNTSEAVPALIEANSQNRRYSVEFVTNNSGYVYLVIENDDNALSISEVMLFKSYAPSSGRLVESAEPIDRTLSVNNKITKLEKLPTSISDAENIEKIESPATGDSLTPLIILVVTFVISAAFLVLTKKGGEQA